MDPHNEGNFYYQRIQKKQSPYDPYPNSQYQPQKSSIPRMSETYSQSYPQSSQLSSSVIPFENYRELPSPRSSNFSSNVYSTNRKQPNQYLHESIYPSQWSSHLLKSLAEEGAINSPYDTKATNQNLFPQSARSSPPQYPRTNMMGLSESQTVIGIESKKKLPVFTVPARMRLTGDVDSETRKKIDRIKQSSKHTSTFPKQELSSSPIQSSHYPSNHPPPPPYRQPNTHIQDRWSFPSPSANSRGFPSHSSSDRRQQSHHQYRRNGSNERRDSKQDQSLKQQNHHRTTSRESEQERLYHKFQYGQQSGSRQGLESSSTGSRNRCESLNPSKANSKHYSGAGGFHAEREKYLKGYATPLIDRGSSSDPSQGYSNFSMREDKTNNLTGNHSSFEFQRGTSPSNRQQLQEYPHDSTIQSSMRGNHDIPSYQHPQDYSLSSAIDNNNNNNYGHSRKPSNDRNQEQKKYRDSYFMYRYPPPRLQKMVANLGGTGSIAPSAAGVEQDGSTRSWKDSDTPIRDRFEQMDLPVGLEYNQNSQTIDQKVSREVQQGFNLYPKSPQNYAKQKTQEKRSHRLKTLNPQEEEEELQQQQHQGFKRNSERFRKEDFTKTSQIFGSQTCHRGFAIKDFSMNSRAGAKTKQGIKENQDSCFYDKIEINLSGGGGSRSSNRNSGVCPSQAQIFGVCDGHGKLGHDVSAFIKQKLPRSIKNELRSNLGISSSNETKQVISSLKQAFKSTALDLKTSGIDTWFSGSTCVSVVILENQVFCANLGDSRAIIGLSNNTDQIHPLAISKDQKPGDYLERHRIVSSGGRVEQQKSESEYVGPQRVWVKDKKYPGLAMSRSFGDDCAEQVGVISEPEIATFTLGDDARFLVLASDGLWDVMSNEEVVQFVAPFAARGDAKSACDGLIQKSYSLWKQESDDVDDITVVVILFEQYQKEEHITDFTSNSHDYLNP